MGLAYLIIPYMNLPGIMTILEQAFGDETQFGDISYTGYIIMTGIWRQS